MDSEGIKALSATAKAYAELARLAQMRERSTHAAKANEGGSVQKYKVGDKVAFYIPPTTDQAKAAGRKAKHLPYFRGPAIVVKVLSATTYQLEYRGRTYKRNTAELRKYKPAGLPTELPTANDDAIYDTNLVPGKFVALKDTADPDDTQFSVAKVASIDADEDTATLHYYGTKTANLAQATWKPLLKWDRVDPADASRMTHSYKLGGLQGVRYKQVADTIPMSDPRQDFARVAHCDLQLLPSGKLAKKSRVQLEEMGVQHHRLHTTFS